MDKLQFLAFLLGQVLARSSAAFGPESTCTSEDAIAIWTGMPSCEPRQTLVKVPTLLDPSLSQIIPELVSVSRCAGTCHQGNQYHNCIPTRTRTRTHKVMIQRLNRTGHLYPTCSEVQIEEHEACACGCRISAENCKTNQYFNSNLCRCDCVDRAAMANCYLLGGPVQNGVQGYQGAGDSGGQKIWDPVNCRCRCAESFQECSTGYIYDQTDTCRCVPELRPASTVPIVALVVALVGTMTCLVLVVINNRRTKRSLRKLKQQTSQIEAEQQRQQRQQQQQNHTCEKVHSKPEKSASETEGLMEVTK